MDPFVAYIQRSFNSKMPDRQIIAIYRMGTDKALVHATKDGKPSAEPNTYTVTIDGSVKLFSPIDNLQKYHRIHDPKNLVWSR